MLNGQRRKELGVHAENWYVGCDAWGYYVTWGRFDENGNILSFDGRWCGIGGKSPEEVKQELQTVIRAIDEGRVYIAPPVPERVVNDALAEALDGDEEAVSRVVDSLRKRDCVVHHRKIDPRCI